MIQTPSEAGRLFGLAYAGKRARLCLAVATSGSPALGASTSVWDAAELSGQGYARAEWTIPSGAYNTTTERFEVPAVLAQFTASVSGLGMSWNRVYLVVGTTADGVTTWEGGVSFVLNESSTITLAAGATKTYNVTLFTDGFTVTA